MSSMILFDVATLFCLHFHFPQKESLRQVLTSRKFILGSDSENQSEGTRDKEAEKRKSITELSISVGNFSSILRTTLRPWVSVPKHDGEALSTSGHPHCSWAAPVICVLAFPGFLRNKLSRACPTAILPAPRRHLGMHQSQALLTAGTAKARAKGRWDIKDVRLSPAHVLSASLDPLSHDAPWSHRHPPPSLQASTSVVLPVWHPAPLSQVSPQRHPPGVQTSIALVTITCARHSSPQPSSHPQIPIPCKLSPQILFVFFFPGQLLLSNTPDHLHMFITFPHSLQNRSFFRIFTWFIHQWMYFKHSLDRFQSFSFRCFDSDKKWH